MIEHLSADTLRAIWDDLAAALIAQGSASTRELAELNGVALELGRKRGRPVSLSGQGAS